MKAVEYKKYGTPEVLEINEMDKPAPKTNEVLIKVHSTTVTAVDSIFRNGKEFFARLATGISKPKKTVLGFEFSGVVESTGGNVKLFQSGDKVFGAFEGTHAEYICVPEESAIITMPEHLGFNEAAAIPAGALTALPFLRDNAKLKNGDKIIIIGASGSVGSYAVQFAKYFGAEVTAVCSGKNAELVKSLGADSVIDYTKDDFTQNGQMYDIVFDTVGKSSFADSKNSLKENGKFLTTFISWSILFQMMVTSKIGSKKAEITFTGMRKPADKIADLKFIKELVTTGKLKPVIDKTFQFENVSEAHALVDSGHKVGNVILKMENL